MINFGSQLYTFRKEATEKSKLPKLFARLKEYGCGCIQISAICAVEPKELRQMADDYGLEIPCTHSPFERIIGDTARLAEEHLILGAKSIGLGHMPLKYLKGESGLKEFIEVANKVAEDLKPYGLTFAYHNHNLEFKKLGEKRKLDILIEQVPDLDFIFDTYWCRFAGCDPVEYMKKLAGRATTIHLKDYKKGFIIPKICDVGAGTLDFPAILAAAEAGGTGYAVIEHDTTRNPYETTRVSMEYLQKICAE